METHKQKSSSDEQEQNDDPTARTPTPDVATLQAVALERLAWTLAADGLYVSGRALDGAQQVVLCAEVLTLWHDAGEDLDQAVTLLAGWLTTRGVGTEYGGPVITPTKAERSVLRRIVLTVWRDLTAWVEAGRP